MQIIFSRPLYRYYFAPCCTLSRFLAILIILLKITIPFLICFFTYSFWNFRQSYLEVPKITPTWDYFFRLIKTNSSDSVQYDNNSTIVSSNFKKIFYDDGVDEKSYLGEIRFEVCVDMLLDQDITYASFTYLPVFEINKQVSLKSQAYINLEYSSDTSIMEIKTIGSLSLLYNKKNSMYKKINNIESSPFNISDVNSNPLEKLHTDPVSVVFVPIYPNEVALYTQPPLNVGCVNFDVKLLIKEMRIFYYPGWIGNLKFAFIEYMFVFMVMYKIIDIFPRMVFGNRYLQTYIADENEIPSTVDGTSDSVHNAQRRGSSFYSYKYAVSHSHQL